MTNQRFFSYDPDGDGFVLHDTAEAAQASAENALEAARDGASECWSENTPEICWGEARQQVVQTACRPPTEEERARGWDEVWDFELQDVAKEEGRFDSVTTTQPTTTPRRPRGVTLDIATRAALRATIRRLGWRRAQATIGVGYHALARGLRGGRVLGSTAAVVRLAVAAQQAARAEEGR